jgi:integrase
MIAPFQSVHQKTGKLRYGGQWLIKYKVPDGTWRREVAGSTKKEAESRLRGILTDMERGTWVDPRAVKEQARETAEAPKGPQTWGELCDKFSSIHYTLKEQKRSRSAFEYMREFLANGREGSGALLSADTPIEQLTPLKLRTVYDQISAFDLSVATRNQVLTYLKVVFKWAAGHPSVSLNANPMEGLKKLRSAGSRGESSEECPVELDEVFTLEEVQKMIAYARAKKGACNAAMLETAFATGMRRGELYGLKWEDVDFEKTMLSIRHNYDRKPKSGKSRVVPIEASLGTSLKVWKAQSPYSKDKDFVFPTPEGAMRAEGAHWAAFVKRTAQKAGVLRPGLSRFGHLTRHTFATLYLRAGGSDVLLAKMLGHKDTRLVHQVYAHFCADDLAADMLRCGFSLDGPRFQHRRNGLSRTTSD